MTLPSLPAASLTASPLTLGALAGLVRVDPRGCLFWAAGGLGEQDWGSPRPAWTHPTLCRSAAAGIAGPIVLLGPAGLAVWPVGGSQPARALDLAPDGGPLAVDPAGQSAALVVAGEVTVVGVTDGAIRLRWAAPGPVRALAFSPDGSAVAAAGGDGRGPGWCALLDLTRGGEVGRAPTPAAATCVAFAPDGLWLAGGGRHVTLWNLRATSEGQLDPQPGDVTAVAASAGGLAAVGYRGGPLALWRLAAVARGAYAGGVDGHPRTVRDLRFLAGGAGLASAGDDQAVMLWEPPAASARRRLAVGQGAIESLAVSATRLLVGQGDGAGQVRSWPGALLERTLGQHPGGLFAAAWSPDGRLLVTGGGDGRLRRWGARRGELQGEASSQGPGQGVAFSPDGRAVLVTDEGGLARWPLPLAARLPGLPELTALTALSGLAPRSVRPVAAARLLAADHGRALGPCRALATSGATVAVGGSDGRVHLGDGTSAGHPVRACEGQVWALACSPTEPLVAAGGDGEVALLDPRFGERLLRHPLAGGRVGALAFSPDGRSLAVASADGLVRLLAVDTGRWTTLARAHVGELTSALWTPVGLLTGSRDGLLVRWTGV